MKGLVMTRTAQIRLGQLLIILAAWLLFGVLMTVYDHLVLFSRNSLGTSDDYSFWFSLAMNMGSGLIGAAFGGSLMVFYINVKYRDKPYGQTILAVAVGYIAVIGLIVLVLGAVFVPLRTGRPLSDPVTQEALGLFLSDTSRIKNIMTWSVVVAFTQLVLQVNNKFGQGTFVNIIRGKYQIPKQEKRIFMFLDLNGSTTMAERLGDARYHMLLKDFFADITNPILDNRGQIYQYVGDEVVIAWNYSDGTEHGRCVRCFLASKSVSTIPPKSTNRATASCHLSRQASIVEPWWPVRWVLSNETSPIRETFSTQPPAFSACATGLTRRLLHRPACWTNCAWPINTSSAHWERSNFVAGSAKLP